MPLEWSVQLRAKNDPREQRVVPAYRAGNSLIISIPILGNDHQGVLIDERFNLPDRRFCVKGFDRENDEIKRNVPEWFRRAVNAIE